MNVLIIEDHPITAMGIEQVFDDHFDSAKIHFAINGKEAIQKLNSMPFKVIVMDIVLPETDTHALLFETLRIQPDSKILIHSNYQDEIYAMPYISMGASGYLNKSSSELDFVQAIKLVMAGQLVLSQQVMRKNMNHKTNSANLGSPFQKLSKRELEFFNHLIKGDSIKDISTVMHIEPSTSATLKKRMMKKLGVTGMVELIKVADEFGYK